MTSLCSGSHADLRALICGLPIEPTPHLGDDAGARRIRRPLHYTSVGNQSFAGNGGHLSPAQATLWRELSHGRDLHQSRGQVEVPLPGS